MTQSTLARALEALLALSLILLGCEDPTGTSLGSESETSQGRLSTSGVEFGKTKIVRNESKGNEEYRINVHVYKKDGSAEFASGLYSRMPGSDGVLAMKRKRSGDGEAVYSTPVSNAILKKLNVDNPNSKTCTIKFAAVGEECGNWGECPEESLLGGETWFCACVTKCEVF